MIYEQQWDDQMPTIDWLFRTVLTASEHGFIVDIRAM